MRYNPTPQPKNWFISFLLFWCIPHVTFDTDSDEVWVAMKYKVLFGKIYVTRITNMKVSKI